MRALVLLALWPLHALGWESVCFDANGQSCAPSAGPNTARNRWVGPLDEHRQLFELSRAAAGLPAGLSDTFTLEVFTG